MYNSKNKLQVIPMVSPRILMVLYPLSLRRLRNAILSKFLNMGWRLTAATICPYFVLDAEFGAKVLKCINYLHVHRVSDPKNACFASQTCPGRLNPVGQMPSKKRFTIDRE